MMSESEGESAATHATTTEARAGSTPHMTRYVLIVGLILVIILFSIIVLVGRS
jgi:cobalamin biosynthesis Mg chelatase CobN